MIILQGQHPPKPPYWGKEDNPIKPQYHAAVSAAAGAALYFQTKSAAAAWACVIAGIFIDIDHLPDYFLHAGLKLENFSGFFSACNRTKLPRLYLALHSYELLLVFFLLAHLAGWNAITLGAGAGMLLHILFDQAANSIKYNLKPLFYFISFRGLKRFKREELTFDEELPPPRL